MHVAKTQLGHSSIRTTEQFYAHYSPEFGINRAREVMETRGRKAGDNGPESDPPDNPPGKESSNILDFNELRGENGGGERIRTAE